MSNLYFIILFVIVPIAIVIFAIIIDRLTFDIRKMHSSYKPKAFPYMDYRFGIK